MSDWISCNDKLPHHDQWVVVLASNKSWCSGYLVPLAGIFHERYYDTKINRFSLTGIEGWRVAYWMPLPKGVGKGPFDDAFEEQFKWMSAHTDAGASLKGEK